MEMNRFRNRTASTSSDDRSSISSASSDIEDTGYIFLTYIIMQGYRWNASFLLYTTEEKQFYRFNRRTKDSDAYICAEENCNCRVYVRADKNCVQNGKKYNKHNHGTREKKYNELFVLNLIKAKCADLKTLFFFR